MTHPDILKMNRYGTMHPEAGEYIGNCFLCGERLYDDMPELVESRDGVFCDMACCEDFYEIGRYHYGS